MDVSVVIPVFNAGALLLDAVASVHAQGAGCEVIVVDDGSDQQTREIIESMSGIRAIRQENRGPAAARNRGIELATAPLVAFLDADDVWTAGKLESQVRTLAAHRDAGVTLGMTMFAVRDAGRNEWNAVSVPRLMYSLGAALIRRELFDRVGLLDESLRGSEDVDWFLRARDGGEEIVVTDDVVQLYRRTGENTTLGKDLVDLRFLEVVKRSLDRRRKESDS